MKKISIKREQSQAGLSFAERENRRSAAGGKAKFRPQVKNKLLLLLALLLTAATGAWAQETQGPWISGDCTVTISGDVMTVSGTGAMADYKDSYELPWYGYDIKTIVIESGVTSIGKSAFAKCYNLESVSIPASVTSIGMQAFENCGYDATALTVSFAEGSTPLTISEYAFNDANLKSIDIPNRVTSIGNGAFASCSKLESVSIPASVTSIGNFAFQSCGSYAEALTVSFAEGSTLESIGESTFLEAKLTSINIPNSVISIGTFAFSGCSNLESVSIPASVTSIGYNAFSSCSKLESVSIPASVTSISEGAFRYCGMLAKVYIYAPSLTTYGANAFTSNAAGRKIYVLPEAVDTYKAGWSAYAADIEAMPATTKYTVTLAEGTKDAGNWSIEPKEGLSEGDQVTVKYNGRLKVKGVTATSDAAPAAGKTVDLSTLTADYEAQNGDVLTGTLNGSTQPYKITIADGATVTLDGVTISNGQIACSGNANMILMGANTVTATDNNAAIKIGGPGTTLTITGSGSLTAQGGLEAAGIGTDRHEDGELSFGNIVINGGTVTATGGKEGAGIGTGLAQGQFHNTSITCGDITINGGTVTAIGGLYGAGIGTGPTMSDGGSASITCGDITINGGTVTATGGGFGPGIGTGVFMKYGGESASNRCGNITIGADVTSVTATKGSSHSPNSIGKGYAQGGTQNYGTITIGGDATTYAAGVTASPFTYTPSN